MKKRAYTNANTVIKYILGRDNVELLIKNARIVDKDKDFQGDIYIKDGKIAAIKYARGNNIPFLGLCLEL